MITSSLFLAACAPVLIAPSDHREAPLVQEDLSADLADLYAFRSPNDPTKVVLAMTVNSFTAPSEGTTFNFSPSVRYTFRIDNDGDAVEDATLEFNFRPTPSGGQRYRAVFSGLGTAQGLVTAPTLEPSANAPVVTAGPGGSLLFAGPRDDPFFFDVVGFNRVLGGTGGFSGSDGFAGFNVSAIVAEVPASFLDGGTGNTVQIWATTSRRELRLRLNNAGEIVQDRGEFKQVDRVGNPAVNTALVPSSQKDLFNIGIPSNDASDFAGTLVASLQALGTSQANIGILASVAVPDTLKLDLTMPTGYPNGRELGDDVVDVLFSFIFNQSGVTDLVGSNDLPFQAAFPYLATPWQP